MNLNKLKKLEAKLLALANPPRPIRAQELQSIAKKLGRKKAKRGSEPNWVRLSDPVLCPPISIPDHGGKDIKSRTARSIIDALLNDIDVWKQHINEGTTPEGNDTDGQDDDDDENDDNQD
ncbi:MAG TPA: hypothetical protein VME63_13780 [Dyella sp.]|uniref:hypothetical protein n=1 Tax=Dyella sp. TaxID=1869338 RepID=UPI002B6152E9|nr:hypothetical protein [Dyella sp.]HTV86475.1 hypothetical protein [Dyella sp.]